MKTSPFFLLDGVMAAVAEEEEKVEAGTWVQQRRRHSK